MKIAVIDDERSARNELIYQILHTMRRARYQRRTAEAARLR